MNATGILVGGVIPALFLGLGTVLMRSSIATGASIPTYLAVIGTTIALVGWTVPARVVRNGDGAEFMITFFQPPGFTDAFFDEQIALVEDTRANPRPSIAVDRF